LKTKAYKLGYVLTWFIANLLMVEHAWPSQQSVVQNGSFELPFSGWPLAFWTGDFGFCQGCAGADGGNFVQIDIPSAFAVQTLTTIPGQLYHVSFAISGNSSFPGQSIVQLSWGGTVAASMAWVSPNTSGNGLNYNWLYGGFDLVATSPSTLIQFRRSPESTSAGSYLDDIRAVPVPEPSSIGLVSLCALAGLTARMRRMIQRMTTPLNAPHLTRPSRS
jgi:PEP-CTERM motif